MDKITYNFKNRTALVTGGAQGFGFDIAKRFLESGAKVIIWDIDPKIIEKSLKDLNNSNLSSNIVDVSNYQEVESTVNEITQSSNIDILINNAGITGPTASLWDYDIEMWKKVVEINLMGTFHCCKAVVPNMILNNYPRHLESMIVSALNMMYLHTIDHAEIDLVAQMLVFSLNK